MNQISDWNSLLWSRVLQIEEFRFRVDAPIGPPPFICELSSKCRVMQLFHSPLWFDMRPTAIWHWSWGTRIDPRGHSSRWQTRTCSRHYLSKASPCLGSCIINHFLLTLPFGWRTLLPQLPYLSFFFPSGEWKPGTYTNPTFLPVIGPARSVFQRFLSTTGEAWKSCFTQGLSLVASFKNTNRAVNYFDFTTDEKPDFDTA